MSKNVLVLLAEGFEEVEAVTPIDYLRRAGINVTTVAIGKYLAVNGAHDIPVSADTALDDLLRGGKLAASDWDAVILPGGLPGADNLAASKETGAFLLEMAKAGKWVCAICAAPARVLSPLGLLSGRKFTCFPGEEEKVIASSASFGAQWREERVVVDGCIITSRGAGTAGEFACTIIEKLAGEGEGEKIAGRVLMLT